MPTTTITLDAREVLEALNRLREQAEDLTPALNAIGGSLKSKIQLGFRSSTSPSGQRWAPLKFAEASPWWTVATCVTPSITT